MISQSAPHTQKLMQTNRQKFTLAVMPMYKMSKTVKFTVMQKYNRTWHDQYLCQ